MQASTDLSVLDFDIPFSAIFVVTGAMDLLAVIAIVAFVTWEVLLIAIPAIVASTYVQVYTKFCTMFLISKLDVLFFI